MLTGVKVAYCATISETIYYSKEGRILAGFDKITAGVLISIRPIAAGLTNSSYSINNPSIGLDKDGGAGL